MFIAAVKLFMINPLLELWHGIKSNFFFLVQYLQSAVMCLNISSVTKEECLQDVFKVFKLLIFCVLTNVAINEAFFDINSDIVNDLGKEALYFLFFYFTFIIVYYIGFVYGKIVKSDIPKVFLVQNWMLIMITTTIVLQSTGVLNPSKSIQKILSVRIAEGVGYVVLAYFFLLIFQYFKLLKGHLIKWYDIFFYIMTYGIFFVLIVIKGLLIENLVK